MTEEVDQCFKEAQASMKRLVSRLSMRIDNLKAKVAAKDRKYIQYTDSRLKTTNEEQRLGLEAAEAFVTGQSLPEDVKETILEHLSSGLRARVSTSDKRSCSSSRSSKRESLASAAMCSSSRLLSPLQGGCSGESEGEGSNSEGEDIKRDLSSSFNQADDNLLVNDACFSSKRRTKSSTRSPLTCRSVKAKRATSSHQHAESSVTPARTKAVPFKFKKTVRGNKRKQLDAVSCDECQKFYEASGMSEAEIKRIIKDASKHRHVHVPPPEPADMWNMDFPETQQDPKQQHIRVKAPKRSMQIRDEVTATQIDRLLEASRQGQGTGHCSGQDNDRDNGQLKEEDVDVEL